MRRGHTATSCVAIIGGSLEKIVAAAAAQPHETVIFSDLSLGAWFPNQIANELLSQIAPAPAKVNSATFNNKKTDFIAALIDRETAGHIATQRAFALAQSISAILIRAKRRCSIFVFAPIDGSELGEDNEALLGFLGSCAPDLIVVYIAARTLPTLPDHWEVTIREAGPTEIDASQQSFPLFPGIITEQVAALHLTADQAGGLRPLTGAMRLIPIERRADSESHAGSLFPNLSADSPTAANPWLSAFIAVSTGQRNHFLMMLAWQAMAAGSSQLGLRLITAAVAQQDDEVSRARMLSIAQGMRIGVQDFAAIVSEPDPPTTLPPDLFGQLLQHKGWGLVMTGRSDDALPYFERARALLRREPVTREFLYLLNISALVHFRRNEIKRAFELEEELRRLLLAMEGPDPHIEYLNALNTGRLALHDNQWARAEQLFETAFDTSLGCWTTGDWISRSVYAATIAERLQDNGRARAQWLHAALAWASDPLPEAIPQRLAGLILHGELPARHYFAEAVSHAFVSKLIEIFEWQSPTAEPISVIRTEDASPQLLGAEATVAIGCKDWVVLASPIETVPGYDGPSHRKLRSLLFELLNATPFPAMHEARTIVVDDRSGRGLPAGRQQMYELCLRAGVGRAHFAGDRTPMPLNNAELQPNLVIDLGPAVTEIKLAGSEPMVAFRRYRPPYALTQFDVELLSKLASATSLRQLEEDSSEPEVVLARLRALEDARIVVIGLPQTTLTGE